MSTDPRVPTAVPSPPVPSAPVPGVTPPSTPSSGRTGNGLPKRSAASELWRDRRRSAVDHLVSGLAVFSTALVLLPLVVILGYLIYKGASSLNLSVLHEDPGAGG